MHHRRFPMDWLGLSRRSRNRNVGIGKRYGLLKPYPGLIAGCGVIDITGYLTSQGYYNQVVWGLRKTPYIGVRPVNHSKERLSKTVWRGTDAIESWTWDGCEGKEATIEVYSDADFVEIASERTIPRQKRERAMKAVAKQFSKRSINRASWLQLPVIQNKRSGAVRFKDCWCPITP